MLLSLRPACFLKVSGKVPESQGVQGHDWGKRVVGRAPQVLGGCKKLGRNERSSGLRLVQLAEDGSVLGTVQAPAIVEDGRRKGLVSVHGEAIGKPKELSNIQTGRVWTSENGRFAVTPLPPLPGASPWRRWLAIWDRSPERGKSKAHVIEWHLPIGKSAAPESGPSVGNAALNGTDNSERGTSAESAVYDRPVEETLSTGTQRNARSESEGKPEGVPGEDWLWLAVSDDGRSVVGLRTDRQLSAWEADELHACGGVHCQRCSFRTSSSVQGARRVGESELKLPFLNGLWRDIGPDGETTPQPCASQTLEETADVSADQASLESAHSALLSKGLDKGLETRFPTVRFHTDVIVGRSISLAFASISEHMQEGEGLGASAGVHCGCCGGVLDVTVAACHIKPLSPADCRQGSDLMTSDTGSASTLGDGKGSDDLSKREGDEESTQRKAGVEKGDAEGVVEGLQDGDGSGEGLTRVSGEPDDEVTTKLERSIGPETAGLFTDTSAQEADPVSGADLSGPLVRIQRDEYHVWTVKRIGPRQQKVFSCTTFGTIETALESSGPFAESGENDVPMGSFPGCLGTPECEEWRRRASETLALEWDPSGALLAVAVRGESNRGGRAGRLLILNHELETVGEVDWEKEVLGLGRKSPEKSQGTEKGSLQRTGSGGALLSMQSNGANQSGGILSPTFQSADDGTAAGVLFRGVLSPTHEPQATASGGLFSPPANRTATRGAPSASSSQRTTAFPEICGVAWAPPRGAILAAVDTAGHVALFDRLGRVMTVIEGALSGSAVSSTKPSLRSFFGRTKAPNRNTGPSDTGPQKYLRKEVWTQGLWDPDKVKAGTTGKLRRSSSGTLAESGGRGRTDTVGGETNGPKRAARSTSPFRTFFSLGRSSGSGRSGQEAGSITAKAERAAEPYSLCIYPSTSLGGGGASVHVTISRGKHVAVWTVPGIGTEYSASMLMATATGEAVENVLPLHVDKSPAVRAGLTWRTAAVLPLGDRCDGKGYYQGALLAVRSELCAALASLAPPDGHTCQRHVRVAADAMAAAARLDTRYRTSRPALWLTLQELVESLFEAGHLRCALHLCCAVLPVLDGTALSPGDSKERRLSGTEAPAECRHERTRGVWKLIAHLARQKGRVKGGDRKEEIVLSESGQRMLAFWAAGGPILDDGHSELEKIEPGELADVIVTEALRRAGVETASGEKKLGHGTDPKLEGEVDSLASEAQAAVSDGDEHFLLGQEDAAAAAYARAGVLGLPRVLAVHVHRCDVSAAVGVMHLAEDLCEKAGRESDGAKGKRDSSDGGEAADAYRTVLRAQCRKHPRVVAAVFASMCREFGLLMAAWSHIISAGGPVSEKVAEAQYDAKLAFPSPLSWRGLGFDGRRVRVDPQSFAQGVAHFELGASAPEVNSNPRQDKAGEALADSVPARPSAEAPGGESHPVSKKPSSLSENQKENATPFSNPAVTSRRPSFAESNPISDGPQGIADPAFDLAARIVFQRHGNGRIDPALSTEGSQAQEKAGYQLGERSPEELSARKLERRRFWAIAAAVDWLVKGGEREAAAGLLRGAGDWRQAAETAMEIARELQGPGRDGAAFAAAAVAIVSAALDAAARRADVDELADVLELAERLLGAGADGKELVRKALENLDERILRRARALPVLNTGRPNRRALDGDQGEPASEAKTAAALRKTLAVLLRTLRPFLCQSLDLHGGQLNIPPPLALEDETLRESIHTALDRLRHVAWYLHCRATLPAMCTKHREIIHTLATAPGTPDELERDIAGWACRLLVGDRYHPARELQATVVAVCASLKTKEPRVVEFLERRIPKGRSSLSTTATLEGMRRVSYTTLTVGRNGGSGMNGFELPLDTDVDPVRTAFLSELERLLWEYGQGEPANATTDSVPQSQERVTHETKSQIEGAQIADVSKASPGPQPVRSIGTEADDGDSSDSSEESLVALEVPNGKRESASASSTPLSVLSPASRRGSRGFSRGLEVAAGAEARGSVSQAESCASVAGASTGRHVSSDVGRSVRGSKKNRSASTGREKAALSIESPAGSGSETEEEGASNEKAILEKIRSLVVPGGKLSPSKSRARAPKKERSASSRSAPKATRSKTERGKTVAIQAEFPPQVDQNLQTSPNLEVSRALRAASARACAAAEDGELERSSGEMYSSGDESAGAAATIVPEYVQKDRPAPRKSVRRAHHAAARGARAATTQTEEEGVLGKTAVERVVEEKKREVEEETAKVEERRGDENREDALYVQTVREQKELEHLEAAATILAKAGIQENVYLFGSSRGGFSATASQAFGLSGRLTGVLRNTGRPLASSGTLLRSGEAASGIGVNRATQALQCARRTVALESGFRPRDLFTPEPPPEPEQEALLGVTGHPLGFRQTRRVVDQTVGGLGTGLRLLTAADVSASGRRFLRTQTAPAGAGALATSRSSTLTRAQTMGRVSGRTGLFESLRSDVRTAASLGSTSFVALAETVKSGGFADVSHLQSDAKNRVSWASDDDGRPEAFGSGTVPSGKLMRTQTRRMGFEGEPRGAPVQRELFRVRSGRSAERNGWGGDEEPELWEHTSAMQEPEFRPVSRSASLRSRSGTERKRTARQKSERLSASESRRQSTQECPSGDSFSGSELVPADRTEPLMTDAAFRSQSVRKATGKSAWAENDGFESRFEKLEDTAERAYSAAAAATSGAEAWVQGLVTMEGRRTRKTVRRQTGTGALPAEQMDAFVEKRQEEFPEEATSTAERRRIELEELGGVRLLRRTMTRGAHRTANFASTNQRASSFDDDNDSGGMNADARALRDAILMQAASSRQAYEELCDVIARFAGAGRVFGGDDLRALDTVASGRGLGVSRATARGFEKGRVAKMMRKLMAKLGDPEFDANEELLGNGCEGNAARPGSARGFEAEIPVKQERKKTVRGGAEIRDDMADDVAAAAEHARNLAGARIQAHVRGYLVRRRLLWRSPVQHISPRPASPDSPKAPIHTVLSVSNHQKALSPRAPGATIFLEAAPRPASASARALSPARESSYGNFSAEGGGPERDRAVPKPTVPPPPENETKDQRIFRVLLEEMTATLGEVEAAAASFERDVAASQHTMDEIEREKWEQKQRYLRAVLGEAHKIGAEIDREETEVDAVRGLVAVYESNAVWG
ncbi:hypothetical protein KFL_002480100 [Klebsormidium nitens]|uniref:Uncharacterized protein n=1 Tax=Klebsormidium nitens TaxID=105231 RepID=A0A1Y1I6W0_KLENI|nr:hypothetical protein KFL_002480100 [Klebsormidium nitens]|eukprot:GAQ85672.1 hypothetical protein KFL_002480100 [Klebsormidium nitens]